MGLIRTLVKSVVSRRLFEKMERESRLWMMRCNSCGHERSIWDLGGLRYKAVGSKKRLYRCPRCGITTHELYKREEDPGDSARSR